MGFLSPRADVPGSILFVGYNEDKDCNELRKHNFTSGKTEVMFIFPEWEPDGIVSRINAFEYSEKHKMLIIDWRWWSVDSVSDEYDMIRTYVQDETGRYVEDRTLFENLDSPGWDFRYFYYAEQIDRLCVGIDGGVDFVNVETGETEDRLELREDGKAIKSLDWNSDFTELVYTVKLRLPVYLYDMKTGVSRELPWEGGGEPQFAWSDRRLIACYANSVGRYNLETDKRTRVANIDSIIHIEVSPDQNYVAVLSFNEVGFFGTDKLFINIVDLSTGNVSEKLLYGEILGGGGILWIAE
jgi:hypothetical protein